MPDLNPRITVESGKMGGKPCIRGLRFTVYDLASYLASGMTESEILQEFPGRVLIFRKHSGEDSGP